MRSKIDFLVLLCAVVVFGTNPALALHGEHADGSASREFVRFNEFTGSNQYELVIASNPAGDRLMGAWTSRKQNNGVPGVYARFYGEGWQELGNEIQVSSTPAAHHSPAITATSAGFLVAWTVQSDESFQIWARGFDFSGNPTTEEALIRTGVPATARPVLCLNAESQTVGLIWRSTDGVEGIWLDTKSLAMVETEWSIPVADPSKVSEFAVEQHRNGLLAVFSVGSGRIGAAVVAPEHPPVFQAWQVAGGVEPTVIRYPGRSSDYAVAWTALADGVAGVQLARLAISTDPDSARQELLILPQDSTRVLPGSSPSFVQVGSRVVLAREIQEPRGEVFLEITDLDGNPLAKTRASMRQTQSFKRSAQVAGLDGSLAFAAYRQFGTAEHPDGHDKTGVGVSLIDISGLSVGVTDTPSAEHVESYLDPIPWPEQTGVEPVDPIKLSENGEPGFMVAENPSSGIPADPAIAVSPTQIVAMVNSRIYVTDKLGNIVCEWDLNEMIPGYPSANDPVCFYDPVSSRFVIGSKSLTEVGGSKAVAIAISNASTLQCGTFSSQFSSYVLEEPTSNLDNPDYPKIGFNEDYIFLTYAGGTRSLVSVFDRATTSFITTPFDPQNPLGPTTSPFEFGPRLGVFYVMPTRDYDQQSEIQYLLTEFTNGKSVAIRALYPDPGNPGELALSPEWFPLAVDEFFTPFGMRQKDSAFRLPVGMHFPNHAVKNDGMIWFATTSTRSESDSTPTIRWYKINPNGWPLSGQAPSLEHEGILDLGPSVASAYAGISVQGQGTSQKAVIVYARSAPDEPVSFGRSVICHDGSVSSSEVWKSSSTPVFSGRWGDYFCVEPDPSSPGVFWGHGSYRGQTAWRSWVGSVDTNASCP